MNILKNSRDGCDQFTDNVRVVLLINVDGSLIVLEQQCQTAYKLLIGIGVRQDSFGEVMPVLLAISVDQEIDLLEG